MRTSLNITILWATWIHSSAAQSAICSTSLTPNSSAPILASGWQAHLVATGLTKPRGIIQDSQGGLLVVQQNSGVVHFRLSDAGGSCVDVVKKTILISQSTLNHGITLSNDGKTLYASSSDAVFSWSYNASTPSVSGNKTLINGMTNPDHATRTLLMSQKRPGMLVVSRGSNANIDLSAEQLASGHSQIKAFDLSKSTATPYNFTAQGLLLGWGLRNSVGVAEEPVAGGIWSVENSVDQVNRSGVDDHQNNPGEELNFHGFLNGSTVGQGENYGYPDCFAVWDNTASGLGNLVVGNQFVMTPNGTFNDTTCAKTRVPPRLTFQAHMAPLDIVFAADGSTAYVSFHGSWDRTVPVGYKVSAIQFMNGQPVSPSTSTTSTTDIFSNSNISICPKGCFRPVGLVIDSAGRIFVTSDLSGELWVLANTGSTSSASNTKMGTWLMWNGLFVWTWLAFWTIFGM